MLWWLLLLLVVLRSSSSCSSWIRQQDKSVRMIGTSARMFRSRPRRPHRIRASRLKAMLHRLYHRNQTQDHHRWHPISSAQPVPATKHSFVKVEVKLLLLPSVSLKLTAAAAAAAVLLGWSVTSDVHQHHHHNNLRKMQTVVRAKPLPVRTWRCCLVRHRHHRPAIHCNSPTWRTMRSS
uniref:Putative secreted peptide n=1 Tax=Anopheles braziliensis TaxID=58242 RepID=A0A2M3ZTE4_9DIPT